MSMQILKNCFNLAGALILMLSLLKAVSTAKTKPYFCFEPHSADGFTEPVVWRCNGELPVWSYNREINECVEFRFGGCGGNDNIFYDREDCEETCKG